MFLIGAQIYSVLWPRLPIFSSFPGTLISRHVYILPCLFYIFTSYRVIFLLCLLSTISIFHHVHFLPCLFRTVFICYRVFSYLLNSLPHLQKVPGMSFSYAVYFGYFVSNFSSVSWPRLSKYFSSSLTCPGIPSCLCASDARLCRMFFAHVTFLSFSFYFFYFNCFTQPRSCGGNFSISVSLTSAHSKLTFSPERFVFMNSFNAVERRGISFNIAEGFLLLRDIIIPRR